MGELNDISRVNLACEQQAEAEAFVRRTRRLAEDFQVPQALLAARRARELDEFNVEAHYLGGVLARRMNRPDEAIEALERACYLEKGLVMGHFLLGHIYHQEDKVVLARHHYEQVLEALEHRADDEQVRFAEGMSVNMLRGLCAAGQKVADEAG